LPLQEAASRPLVKSTIALCFKNRSLTTAAVMKSQAAAIGRTAEAPLQVRTRRALETGLAATPRKRVEARREKRREAAPTRVEAVMDRQA
jgi:hypothetical protein